MFAGTDPRAMHEDPVGEKDPRAGVGLVHRDKGRLGQKRGDPADRLIALIARLPNAFGGGGSDNHS